MPKQPPPTTPKRLVPVKEAAEQVRVHPMTIRRWIAEGRLPGYRLGPRALRVDLDDLDAMVQLIPTAGGGSGRVA